jgi:hypothetical protein
MRTPQFLLALVLIGLFAAAYFTNPADEMMKGALLGYAAAAVQFFLGSSTGSKQNGDVVRRIAEQPSVLATGDQPTINGPTVAAPVDDEPDPAMFGGPRA